MNVRSSIALLCLAVTATFGTMIAAPAVKLLAVAFPDTDALLVQWVVTLSSLFILPSLFMAGYLSRRFPRKNILIAGLVLYLIGGVGPALSDSLSVIFVFRAVLGLGVGLISPTFNSLIAGGTHTMLYFLIPTNLSLYLADNGIGTVSTVGYLSALSLIGTFAAGTALTVMARLLGRLMVPLVLLLMSLGFWTIAMAHEVWTAAAAVCLIGFAEGVLFPATFNKAAEGVPRASLTAAISLLLSCIYTFQFLSPLFMKGIQLLFHFHSTREIFMLVACGLGLAAIAYLPLMRTRKTQEPQGTQAASHSRG